MFHSNPVKHFPWIFTLSYLFHKTYFLFFFNWVERTLTLAKSLFFCRKIYYLKLRILKLHTTKPTTIKWSTSIFEYEWKNNNSSTFLCLIESTISAYCGNTFIKTNRDQMLIMKAKHKWIILCIDPDTLELQSALQILFYENVLRAQMYRPLGSNYP